MPLAAYGALRGPARELELDTMGSPHVHFLVEAPDGPYDVSVNVRSSVPLSTVVRDAPPNQVLFHMIDSFVHPLQDQWLKALQPGFTDLRERRDLSVDFIRSNLFDPSLMRPLPHDLEGDNNDLFEMMSMYVNRAIRDPEAEVFVFGEPWPVSDRANTRFGFRPDRGVHNVHMNQGNDPNHRDDDGVFQDGALFFRYGGDRWVALFIAFQAQCWHTDDETGADLEGFCERPGLRATRPDQDRAVLIIAATPNPFGQDVGAESVHLCNPLGRPINIDGWSLSDRNNRREPLSGEIPANDVRKIILSGDGAQLGNRGGRLTLLNAEGRKIHGVAYTRDDANPPGLTTVFGLN